MPPSIFVDFTLPNSATWFYVSFFLAVALFYHFGRPWAVRNWDLLALFLFVPGFLLLQESNQLPAGPRAGRERFAGYAWLLGASLLWFVRCLLDLAFARRPVAAPNLSPAGLAWLGGALFVGLTAVAYTRPDDPWGPVGKRPAVVSGVESGAAAVVAHTQPEASPPAVRFWVERTLALVCHAAVVTGLVLIGWRQFGDLATGLAAGVMYLLVPYTGYHIGQLHHVLPAALILWAVCLFRHPLLAGVLLGLAAGTAFFPLLLVPAWTQFYRGRGLGRFAAGFLLAGLLGLVLTLYVVAAAGQFPDGVWRTLNLSDWQPWQSPTADSIWTGAHWAYRLPVFVLYAGFVVTIVFWPPVRNLGQLLAATAATLIGIQFWFADRGGQYVLWYAPLLILIVLRPTLSEHRPADPGPLPGWITWAVRWPLRRLGLVGPRVDPGRLPIPSSLAPRTTGLADPIQAWYNPAGGVRP